MFAGIILTIGILLCLIASAQLVSVCGQASYAVRQSRRQAIRGELVAEAISEQYSSKAAKLVVERKAWKGWRPMIVAKVVNETTDCKSFYLIDAESSPLPPFVPGQFIAVGLSNEDGTITSRCYSLSDAPDCRYLRITVKRVPTGSMSNRLHDTVRVGSTLLTRAPAGQFVPVEDPRVPLVLIAAGIGITPMVAIARHYQKLQPNRSVQVFYQVRDLEQAPLLHPLSKWAAEHPNARLYLYVSQSPGEKPNWVAGFGRVTIEEIMGRVDVAKSQFMICGPTSMLESIGNGLKLNGVDASRVTVEAFEAIRKAHEQSSSVGASSVEASSVEASEPSVNEVEICFEKSGKKGRCGGAVQTILDAAEASDVPADSGCRNGDCGACVVKLLKGKVSYPTKPSYGPLESSEALACVAVPDGPISVNL